jgi:hypothetical protein
MRIDHRRLHIAVAEELLHRANILAVREKVRGKRMPQRVRPDCLGSSRLSSPRAAPPAARDADRDDAEPYPTADQHSDGRKETPTATPMMPRWRRGSARCGCRVMLAQHRRDGWRKHRRPILVAFTVAHRDLANREVEIFHAYSQSLEQPHSTPVQQAGDELSRPTHRSDQQPDLASRQHCGSSTHDTWVPLP